MLNFITVYSQDCKPNSNEVYYLKNKTLNLRTNPDLKSKIIIVLNENDHSLIIVHEDSIVNNFIYVKAIKDTFDSNTDKSVIIEEYYGWVSRDLVNFNGDHIYFARAIGKAEDDFLKNIISEEEILKSSFNCKYNPTRLSYAYSQQGINLFNSENYLEAIKKFNKSIEIATINSLEHKLVSTYYRACCKLNLNDYYGAIKDFNLIKNEKTTTIGSTMVIGWRFNFKNNNLLWSGYTTPIIDMEMVLLNLSICYARIKKYQEALLNLNTIIKNNKNSGNAYYVMAQIYMAQNLKEKSCIEASKAAELGINEAYDFMQRLCK